MFVINTRACTVEYDPKGKRPEGSLELSTFYVADKAEMKALPTSDLVDIFNAIAKSDPALGIREVTRFATRETAEERTWGRLVQIRALAEGPEYEIAPPAKPKTAKAKTPRVKKPAPVKPAKAKTPRAVDGKKTWKDVVVLAGKKQYEPREGSAQALALKLISRENGVSVDEWIEKMNEIRKKGKWHYGNAWSGLVYLLHTVHGYGLERRNNRFYIA